MVKDRQQNMAKADSPGKYLLGQCQFGKNEDSRNVWQFLT